MILQRSNAHLQCARATEHCNCSLWTMGFCGTHHRTVDIDKLLARLQMPHKDGPLFNARHNKLSVGDLHADARRLACSFRYAHNSLSRCWAIALSMMSTAHTWMPSV